MRLLMMLSKYGIEQVFLIKCVTRIPTQLNLRFANLKLRKKAKTNKKVRSTRNGWIHLLTYVDAKL